MTHERKDIISEGSKFLKEPQVICECQIGACQVVRKEVELADEEKVFRVQYTVVRVPREADFHLVWDGKLADKGAVLEANGFLIDQEKTKEVFGRPAGIPPEELLEGQAQGAMVFCPSNGLWQTGAFLINEGNLITLGDDRGKLKGRFKVVGLSRDGWQPFSLDLQKGKVSQPSTLSEIKIGLSMPLLVDRGNLVSLEEIIEDPRFLADPRNVWDFSAGRGREMEAEDNRDFWRLIRAWLPAGVGELECLLEGKEIVVNREGVSEGELARLGEIIEKYQMEHLHLEAKDKALLIGALPFNRIPVIGFGCDEKKRLATLAVDGYQAASAGATINELGVLGRREGFSFLGLGSAGGDVVVLSTGEDGQIIRLNSPVGGKTRPIPNGLLILPRS